MRTGVDASGILCRKVDDVGKSETVEGWEGKKREYRPIYDRLGRYRTDF